MLLTKWATNTQSVVNTMWPNVKLENEQVQLEENMLVQTERWAYRNTQEGSTQHPADNPEPIC